MINKTNTLYKIDSKGQIRIWYAIQVKNSYTTYAGLEQGTLTRKSYSPKPKGKNTPEEQTQKDMMSRYRKKYERELYSTDLNNPHPLAFTQPMSAYDATKVGHRIDWDNKTYTSQPKLNGVRCTAKCTQGRVTLTSKKGKIYIVPHIQNALRKQIFLMNRCGETDGELYIHGVELGDITHAVAHGDPRLEYRIFDTVDKTLPFKDRHKTIDQIGMQLPLAVVHITPISNLHDADVMHDIHVSAGYEGIVIREVLSLYENKQSLGLFKYKKFVDSEFEIVGCKQDKEGGAIFQLITTKGLQFDSRPMGTNQYRRNLWNRRAELPGLMVTVRYSSLLASGLPEFNRTRPNSNLRDYE